MAETKTTVKKITTKKAIVKTAPKADLPAGRRGKKAVTKVENTAAVATVKKTGSLKTDVFDMTGKVVESVSLPEALFGAKINKPLMAQAVRVYLANQRSGTASTKTRGEVTGSTRKIYRQKGTGRARHGGVRAPIFVKGGVAHGPKPTDFSLSMPQKMRQKALFSALSVKVKDSKLKVFQGVEKMEPKTKNFAAFLSAVEAENRKSILVVLPEKSEVTKAIRNIENVTYLFATQLNTYEVMTNSLILLTKDAISTMEKHFVKEK